MKSLNIYVIEGLADWGDDDKLNKKMSKQTTKAAIKQEIIDWVINNTRPGVVKKTKSKFKFDFKTDPITVDYDGNIEFKENIDSLTNGLFQWGYINGGFNCVNCKQLKSLEGCPNEIIDGIDCDNCESLVDLKGAPNKVQDLHCNGCKNLKSLEGLPDKLTRLYLENCNSLKNFEALKKHKDSNLRIYTNIEDHENEIKKIYNE